jgi:hypothetical protein
LHSLIRHSIIFWGNSTKANTVLLFQKRVIRIMMGIDQRSSWKGLFKKLDILPVPSEYVFS